MAIGLNALLRAAVLGALAAVVLIGLGQGQRSATAALPDGPYLVCYGIGGPAFDPQQTVDAFTQYGLTEDILVGSGASEPGAGHLCVSATKEGQGFPFPAIRCWNVQGGGQNHPIAFENQFEWGVEDGSTALAFCTPAEKVVPGSPPPDPNYLCFGDNVYPLGEQVLSLETQFGSVGPASVDYPSYYCAPAVKDDIAPPPPVPQMHCYAITSAASDVGPVDITTQFGEEPAAPVNVPLYLCVPDFKTPVGGVAELPDTAAARQAARSTQTSVSGIYVVAFAATLMVFGTTILFAYRWLRRSV